MSKLLLRKMLSMRGKVVMCSRVDLGGGVVVAVGVSVGEARSSGSVIGGEEVREKRADLRTAGHCRRLGRSLSVLGARFQNVDWSWLVRR